MDPALQALISLITGGGPYALAAVFAFLWYGERQERKDNGDVKDKLLERCLNALNANASALGDLRVYLGLERERSDKQGR